MESGSGSHAARAVALRARTRVLVVDDDPVSVRMLSRILSGGGFEKVTTSTNSSEAVELCQCQAFDLLLLDLTMPGVDGFEILEALSGCLSADPPMRAVVLTGHEHPAIARRATDLGASAVVGKTTPRDELLASLDAVLERHPENETTSD